MPGLVSLGPITLPTLKGDIAETLGDQLETVGAGVVPGERRARPLSLTIPIHGQAGDADRRESGLRLRRQVRALIENSQARLQGLYLNWSVDPELNAWLLIGGADVKYARGGVTFGDFELELSDCYRVGNLRTHRAARRLVRLDRRLATTARDILGSVYDTGFSTASAASRLHLGVGVSDPVVLTSRAAPSIASLTTRDGVLSLCTSTAELPDGQVVSFEQAAPDMHKAIVRVYDARGSNVESDWEAVYGADQPLTGRPVLDNAICRVVPELSTGYLDVQSWNGSAWSTDATINQGIPARSAIRVVEWTLDRAVLCMTKVPSARYEWYITLQRGWTGPRVEMYARNAAGNAQAAIGVYVRSVGDATYQRSSDATAVGIVDGTSIGTFAGLAPWIALVGPGTDRAVALAVVQEAVNLRGGVNLGREGLMFESPTSYASVTLALGARADATLEAQVLGQLNMFEQRAVPEIVSRA